MLPCSICSTAFAYARACDQCHPGVCHACASRNFHGNPLDYRAHEAPREPPILTPRAQAAVAAYTAHVRRVARGRALADLVTEERTP